MEVRPLPATPPHGVSETPNQSPARPALSTRPLPPGSGGGQTRASGPAPPRSSCGAWVGMPSIAETPRSHLYNETHLTVARPLCGCNGSLGRAPVGALAELVLGESRLPLLLPWALPPSGVVGGAGRAGPAPGHRPCRRAGQCPWLPGSGPKAHSPPA